MSLPALMWACTSFAVGSFWNVFNFVQPSRRQNLPALIALIKSSCFLRQSPFLLATFCSIALTLALLVFFTYTSASVPFGMEKETVSKQS